MHDPLLFRWDSLGILGQTGRHRTPWASQFVPQMIGLVRRLQRQGRVHREGDSWYYSPPRQNTENFPVGRELARHAVPEPGIPLESLDTAVPDFLVWRRQARPAASWPSPWGAGAPGWHLECFSMAENLLGIPVDVHGGGVDLVYPHHYAENEIALALTGSLFSRHFLHTALVTENGEKMSKSTGNLYPLRQAIERSGPDGLRWYLLTEPFHRRLDWQPVGLDAATVTFAELRARVRESLARGAGGGLSVAELARVVDAAARRLGDGLRAEAMLDLLREWSEEMGRRPRARFARGEQAQAARLYRRLSHLTRLDLAG